MMDRHIKIALDRIREFQPQGDEPYFVAYSGGKDSDVILDLCRRLVKDGKIKQPEIVHNLTTIDPPEVVRHVQAQPDVVISRPRKNFFDLLLEKRWLPMRQARWCCAELKERGGEGRTMMTGVRWAESKERAGRRKMVEQCVPRRANIVNPIVDWSDDQVWNYIHRNGVEYCDLYNRGWLRCGCLFCVYQGKKATARDIAAYPRFVDLFIKMFDRLIEFRASIGLETKQKTGKEIWEWWAVNRRYTEDQIAMKRMQGSLFSDI